LQENNHNDLEIELPIDGNLDLHAFRPNEIGSLIPEYLRECIINDIYHVRIIHGKGSGALQRSVHAILKRLSSVKRYHLADETGGSWGATLVELKKDIHKK
jgi:DNA-nicking Smr family endonuclease